MTLIDFFNDPNSAVIFGCGVGVSTIFIIGIAKALYGPKVVPRGANQKANPLDDY